MLYFFYIKNGSFRKCINVKEYAKVILYLTEVISMVFIHKGKHKVIWEVDTIYRKIQRLRDDTIQKT